MTGLSKIVSGEFYRWLVLAGLAALVLLTTGLVNRNVYDKEEVDHKVQQVQTLHDRDMAAQQRQLDHIEGQVDKLVDVLIEGQ